MIFESSCTTSKENILPFKIFLLYLPTYSFINSENTYKESNFCAIDIVLGTDEQTWPSLFRNLQHNGEKRQ